MNLASSSWSVSIETFAFFRRTWRARRSCGGRSEARRLPVVPPRWSRRRRGDRPNRTASAAGAYSVLRGESDAGGRAGPVRRSASGPVHESCARFQDRDEKLSGDSEVDAGLGFPFEVSLEVDPPGIGRTSSLCGPMTTRFGSGEAISKRSRTRSPVAPGAKGNLRRTDSPRTLAQPSESHSVQLQQPFPPPASHPDRDPRTCTGMDGARQGHGAEGRGPRRAR